MKVLVLTHGCLGKELLMAARTIGSSLSDFEALCLEWDDSIEQMQEKVTEVVARLSRQDAKILILTDMFGSTPCNVASSFQSPGKIAVLAGVNLPMVVRLGCYHREDADLEKMAHWLLEKGRQSICQGTIREVAVQSKDPCDEVFSEKERPEEGKGS